MNKNMSKNAELLMNELYGRMIPLSSDGEKIIDFTSMPNDGFECINGLYYYPYKEEKIPFRLLSDGKVTEYDKKNLLDKIERNEYESIRSLRIASSHLLLGATILIILSDTVKSLVKYQKENEEYIIDYGNNLIMKKDDYDKIFSYEILESIEQCYMPYLNELTRKFSKDIPAHITILFFKEIMEEIKRSFPDFYKYFSGIHPNNRFMVSLKDEFLFMAKQEEMSVWERDVDMIFSFTLDSLHRNFPIFITDDDYFLYKDYKFRRLSDYIIDPDFKSELLSVNRYHKCMGRSVNVLLDLADDIEESNIRLVLGKIPFNNYEKLYHAWVEFKSKSSGKWVTVDYTGNLIIGSDDYIRLRDAEVLRTLSLPLVKELFTYIDNSCIVLDKFPLLFFAEEILDDIKKNKNLYKVI